jgi:hypothetical protein
MIVKTIVHGLIAAGVIAGAGVIWTEASYAQFTADGPATSAPWNDGHALTRLVSGDDTSDDDDADDTQAWKSNQDRDGDDRENSGRDDGGRDDDGDRDND